MLNTLAPLQRETNPESLQAMGATRHIVRVHSIKYQGKDLNEYELVDPNGNALPTFTAGSHIDLFFRDGRIRQYSLCNSEAEQNRYKIVVQRDLCGRGGSKAIFDRVHVGRMLVISEPRNNFPLVDATRYLLIAGGVGITPLMSMVYTLDARNRDFVLHYCTRSPDRTAFSQELRSFVEQGKAFVYHDGGDSTKGLHLPSILSHNSQGTHLYYCGPPGFMQAVYRAASSWSSGTLHYEFFRPPSPSGVEIAEKVSLSQSEQEGLISVGFQIKIASTGQIIEVPNDKTIIQALREHGIVIPTSCESGLCGTCRVRYLAGVPDHRDYILQDDDKTRELLVCCSRSKSQLLVLDL